MWEPPSTKSPECVVFDWNGTLLDDVALAVRAVNHVLCKHSKRGIELEYYRQQFGFPIRDFYRRLGFDLRAVAFEDLMADYLSIFDPGVFQCSLHVGVEQLLARLELEGIRASILSATQCSTLEKSLEHFGLAKRFVHCIGLADSRADGKIELARDMQRTLDVPPESVVYVGDTTHDIEVAAAVGWGCVIVPNGHQLRQSFASQCVSLADDLGDALDRVLDGTGWTA
jgi:phosphoglycolate phosphatase